nr:MAG TPA: KilAC domain protein [Caudoviricetes sp.]
MPCVCCVKHTYGGFLFIIIRYNMLDTTNELIPNLKGMTSLEIAEVTGKRHDAILRDIRNLLKQGVNVHNFVAVEYTDKKGEKRPLFNLTPKGCLVLASGYDAVLREKIIDRLETLELGKPKVPQSFSEALQLAADQAKRIEEQQKQIEQKDAKITKLQPKADFADCIMQSEDCISIGEMANILKQNGLFKKGQNALYEWLRWSGYLLSKGARYNLPTQRSMSLGVMKVAEKTQPAKGMVFINRKAVITPYGQRYFINLFSKGKSVGQCTISFTYK